MAGAIGVAWCAIADAQTTVPSSSRPQRDQLREVEIDGTIRWVEENDLVFDNEVAAGLYLQGKQADPMFASQDDRNRDKAIEFYAAAYAAQPGAKSNAHLANRIGQMYAFNNDPARGIRTDWEQARVWWERCVEASSPRQTVYAAAIIGMNGYRPAGDELVEWFRPLLEMKAEEVELPHYKWNGPASSPARQRQLETQLVRERENVEQMQRKAVERIYNSYRHKDEAESLKAMQLLMERYAGTIVAAEAEKKLRATLNLGPDDPLFEDGDPAAPAVAPQEPSQPGPRATVPTTATSGLRAVTESDADGGPVADTVGRPGGRRGRIVPAVVGIGAVSATCAAAIWLLLRRRQGPGASPGG